MTQRKHVLAFIIQALVVSCDWMRTSMRVELDMTKPGRKQSLVVIIRHVTER